MVDAVERVVREVASEVEQRRTTMDLFPKFGSLDDVSRAILPEGNHNFRWTASRFGRCEDLGKRVEEVFLDLVRRNEEAGGRERIDADQLWEDVIDSAAVRPILPKMSPRTIATDHYRHQFRGSWMNGTLQVVDAISLDYAFDSTAVDTAHKWRGRLEDLSGVSDFKMTAIVTDAPPDADRAWERAVAILHGSDSVRGVFTRSELPEFAQMVERDLATHRA